MFYLQLFNFWFALLLMKYSLSTKLIPKILYRTGQFNNFTEAHNKVKSSLNQLIENNPEYSQIYFSHEHRESFIKEYFPQYLNDYLNVIPGAFQADIFRLLILYQFGGIYNDVGSVYLKHVNEIIEDSDELILAIDLDPYTFCNGFLASYPRHPLIKTFIELVMYNVNNQIYGITYLDITGPRALTRAFFTHYNITVGEPLKSGIHYYKNDKIKFYNLEKLNNVLYISNFLNNTHIIDVKFRGYEEIVYKNKIVYGIYWLRHQVYHNQTISYENELIKDETKKNTYYYIINGYRRSFPTNDIFIKLGFGSGLLLARTIDNITSIPEGKPFSADISEGLIEIRPNIKHFLNEFPLKKHSITNNFLKILNIQFINETIDYSVFYHSINNFWNDNNV